MQVALYVRLLRGQVLTTLLESHLNVYEHFFREHTYGLAKQDFPQVVSGGATDRGSVQLIVTSLLLVGLYAVFRSRTANVVDLGHDRGR